MRIRATFVALLTISALVFGLVSASSVAASKKKGSEGCTPGYWKQDQHFDSWPAGYEPGDSFSSHFDGSTAFGTMTLLQVLQQGGGGLNALGRHAVSALLNTASDDVDTVWTETQAVRDAFNDAVADGGDAIENTKNIFAAANERRCPLN